MDLFVNYNPVYATKQKTNLLEQLNTPLMEQLEAPTQYTSEEPSEEDWTTKWKPVVTNNGNNNLSFEELVQKYNLPIKITSGYRGADGFRGGKTKSGKQSNHNKTDEHGHPMAYDIQPLVNGKVDKSASAFANLRQLLNNNAEVKAWFQQRDWGILDETTPEMMRKTGATGAHFHIGPDRAAVRFN